MLKVALLTLLTALGLSPTPARAQISPAGVVTTLEGSAAASRGSATQPIPLKFKDDVFLDDRITTGDRSLARVLLGGKALVTVRERSVLHITEVPGQSTVTLDSGKIKLTVVRERMRPGETIQIKTPSAIAAVRGTVLVIEVIRGASAQLGGGRGGTIEHWYGFTGTTTITFNDGTTGTLTPGQFFTWTGTGNVNSGPMTPDQSNNAVSGLQPDGVKGGPPPSNAGIKENMTFQAESLVNAIVGGTPNDPPNTPPQSANVIDACNPGPCTQQSSTPPPPPPPPDQSLPSNPPAAQSKATLLFGDAGYGSSRTTIADDLRARGHGVVVSVDKLPGDLSAYKAVWDVGASGTGPLLTLAQRTQLLAFMKNGGGLFATGEASFADGPNGSNGALTGLVRAALKGITTGITIGGQGDVCCNFTDTFNATAKDAITQSPNVLTTWSPGTPGGVAGITGANVLATATAGNQTLTVGGVWDAADLLGSQGELALLMDADWILQNSAQVRRAIVDNMQTFIGDPATTLTFSGPLWHSAADFASPGVLADIYGVTVVGQGTDAFLSASGGTVTAAGRIARMSDSQVTTTGSFLRAENGGVFAQLDPNVGVPFVSMTGGTLNVGTGNAGGNLFEVVGRANHVQADPEPDPITGQPTGLLLGTDQPIQPATGAPVFQQDRGATQAAAAVNGRVFTIDAALLVASARLINLDNHSVLTVLGTAVDLVKNAKVAQTDVASSLVSLNQSLMAVAAANGAVAHLVNVAGGSRLDVAGNLVSLAGSSTLVILNGLLLNVSGGSVVNIGGSLVKFTGVGNLLAVNNTVVPTAIIGGVPVSGTAANFKITGNALAGLGTNGTIIINGVALTSSTPLSSLTGSLVAIQGSGSVKIGP